MGERDQSHQNPHPSAAESEQSGNQKTEDDRPDDQGQQPVGIGKSEEQVVSAREISGNRRLLQAESSEYTEKEIESSAAKTSHPTFRRGSALDAPNASATCPMPICRSYFQRK